jgi:hypothetical protein
MRALRRLQPWHTATFLASAALFAVVWILTPGSPGTSPAFAGTVRYEIQASGTFTSSSNSGSTSVRDLRELTIFVSCTASSGTGETLDLFLQSSSDGGVTWHDLPADFAQEGSLTATEGTASTNKRDIFELAADDLCSTYVGAVGKYKSFGDLIRVRWIIAGTTPSYTFGVRLIGKT